MLSQVLDGDGASLVVHERAHDYHTDPAGNAGTTACRADRTACRALGNRLTAWPGIFQRMTGINQSSRGKACVNYFVY
jgi:hypothetical protein